MKGFLVAILILGSPIARGDMDNLKAQRQRAEVEAAIAARDGVTLPKAKAKAKPKATPQPTPVPKASPTPTPTPTPTTLKKSDLAKGGTDAIQRPKKKALATSVLKENAEEKAPEVSEKKGPGTIVVSAVGDIMLGTSFPSDAIPADGARSLLRAATSYIEAADIRFGNFEGTLFDGPPQADGKRPGPNRYLFRTPTVMAGRLQEAGFNFMSLANNHARDFGDAGLESTMAELTARNIQYSSKRGEVARYFVKGLRVFVIATDFYPGQRSIVDPARTFAEIAELRQHADIVIVSCHAGGEGSGATDVVKGIEFFLGENRGDSIGFAHGAIDAGADLILMHGPHVPRGMEVYRDRLIAYSLGNFATGKGIGISGEAGLAPLLRVQIDSNGKFVQGHIASFQQTRSQGTVYDPSLSAFRLIRDLSNKDFSRTAPKFSGDGFIAP